MAQTYFQYQADRRPYKAGETLRVLLVERGVDGGEGHAQLIDVAAVRKHLRAEAAGTISERLFARRIVCLFSMEAAKNAGN